MGVDSEGSGMKLLFIYTNVGGAHEDNYAFGLATIVSVARKLGHECRVGLVTDEMVCSFNNERCETVLNYDEAWKKQLSYYQKNWERLVYPFWSINYLKSTIRSIPLTGNIARIIYRAATR